MKATLAILCLALILTPTALAEPPTEPEPQDDTTHTQANKYCVDIITSTTPPTIHVYEC